MSELGYIVIEWNQASGMPDLPLAPTLWDRQEDATQEAADLAAEAETIGRRESYRVARVELIEEDETDD